MIRAVVELNHALQSAATSNVSSTRKAQTNGPFWKTAFVLWVPALCGVFLVLPYTATLENKALAAAAAHTHLKVGELLCNFRCPNRDPSGYCRHPWSVGSMET